MKNIFRNFKSHAASTYGSTLRKYWSLASGIVIAVLVIEAAFNILGPNTAGLLGFIAYTTMIWSILFFVLVVVTIPFLSSDRFQPDPIRLFRDCLISILLSVLSFALIYRVYGLIGPDTLDAEKPADFIYFSAVTFSTLGFGDFRPDTDARLLAALQAIIGNLHLGLVVGAVFFAMQKKD